VTAASDRWRSLMQRPKSLSQLVIYSSKVRAIQFAVPALRHEDATDYSNRWNSEPNLECGVGQPTDVISASSSAADRLSSQYGKGRRKYIGLSQMNAAKV
jgi:hypothetical protein